MNSINKMALLNQGFKIFENATTNVPISKNGVCIIVNKLFAPYCHEIWLPKNEGLILAIEFK